MRFHDHWTICVKANDDVLCLCVCVCVRACVCVRVCVTPVMVMSLIYYRSINLTVFCIRPKLFLPLFLQQIYKWSSDNAAPFKQKPKTMKSAIYRIFCLSERQLVLLMADGSLKWMTFDLSLQEEAHAGCLRAGEEIQDAWVWQRGGGGEQGPTDLICLVHNSQVCDHGSLSTRARHQALTRVGPNQIFALDNFPKWQMSYFHEYTALKVVWQKRAQNAAQPWESHIKQSAKASYPQFRNPVKQTHWWEAQLVISGTWYDETVKVWVPCHW